MLNADWRKWPRSQQCALYVVGQLDELRAQGMIRGGFELTPTGRADFAQMQAEGFEVTRDEQARAIAQLLFSIAPL